MRIACLGGVLGLALIAAAACDNGPSAVETRDRSDASPVAALPELPVAAAPAATRASAPAWTSNRRYSSEENLARLYARNGAAFAARSAEDYARMAHAFIAEPPAGAETIRRANGDTLYYDAASNTFLVADRDGTPRTMFKPDDGPAYWARQRASAEG